MSESAERGWNCGIRIEIAVAQQRLPALYWYWLTLDEDLFGKTCQLERIVTPDDKVRIFAGLDATDAIRNTVHLGRSQRNGPEAFDPRKPISDGPEMSAYEVTDKLIEAIRGGEYDLVIVNYANPDMVGHTGKMEAAIEAVEVIDVCLGRLADAVSDVRGALLITADHGNVERMFDDHTGHAHTAHTMHPVPLLLVCDEPGDLADGKLADIAPTVLALMGLEKPRSMTGHSLLKLEPDNRVEDTKDISRAGT